MSSTGVHRASRTRAARPEASHSALKMGVVLVIFVVVALGGWLAAMIWQAANGPAPVARGSVIVLADGQGLDLDVSMPGAIGPGPNDPSGSGGADLATRSRATALVLSAGARAVRLADAATGSGEETPDPCTALADSSWPPPGAGVPGLDRMERGQRICVRTNAGNLSLVTVDRPSDPNSGAVDLHYLTWSNS